MSWSYCFSFKVAHIYIQPLPVFSPWFLLAGHPHVSFHFIITTLNHFPKPLNSNLTFLMELTHLVDFSNWSILSLLSNPSKVLTETNFFLLRDESLCYIVNYQLITFVIRRIHQSTYFTFQSLSLFIFPSYWSIQANWVQTQGLKTS